MMFANCWIGGIGKCGLESLSKLMLWLLDSQVFPSYIMWKRAVTKMSALAKLKEKRAALRQRDLVA